MYGNCVLNSCGLVKEVGIMGDSFGLNTGDIDYGFRTLKSVCKIWIALVFVGECSMNRGKGL